MGKKGQVIHSFSSGHLSTLFQPLVHPLLDRFLSLDLLENVHVVQLVILVGKLMIVRAPYNTVVWSRPPKASPMAG